MRRSAHHGGAGESVASFASAAPARARQAIGKMQDAVKTHGIVIFIAIALVLIVVIIVWLVAAVRRSSIKVVNVTENVVRLDGTSSTTSLPYIFDGSKLPTDAGQEYSMSLWLYMADYNASDRHRLVMRRGGEVKNLESTSPIIFLDRSTNRLHFALRTSQSAQITDLAQVFEPARRYVTNSIEYLPLQRWVHVGLVVQDAVMQIYMDGELYSVTNISDAWGGVSGPSRPIFTTSRGSLFIGDRAAPSRSFVSNVQYFNYALAQRDMQDVYNRGPVRTGFLAMIGLGMYGMRTPIYKVAEDDDENKK